ncbi:homoserine O-acetyltransferase MetX [Nakamurella antarctica]|uniref:homoserine O-acetyltransferase MetX n=1 Tax=Nakamurella antarctica TaxID=1902245 RepID=UPI001EF093C8|nr:homoserine O-acetyltransferase [Nakamurella antarctica]
MVHRAGGASGNAGGASGNAGDASGNAGDASGNAGDASGNAADASGRAGEARPALPAARVTISGDPAGLGAAGLLDGAQARSGVNVPASAIWHGGSPSAWRQFADVGDLDLENGGVLPGVRVAFESWGKLNAARDNAILVLHALTGDAHVVGPTAAGQPTPGWWDGLIGQGAVLDTDKYFVIAPNVLGGCQGTTGPSSVAADGQPYGSRFPAVTMRDLVSAEAALADVLGIKTFHAIIGGSMGGMRVLEWAVSFPDRVKAAVAIAACGYASADQIGWTTPQLAAIRSDQNFAGGDYYDQAWPLAGMAIAREIAHMTYRSGCELNTRFGRDAQEGEDPATGGRFAVQSYISYHGAKLGRRFDPNSYLVLTEAMNSHDVGRGRGGLRAALGRITADLTVAVVDSDRLFPPELGAEIALAPRAKPLVTMRSEYGHDGFLIEADQVSKVVADAIEAPQITLVRPFSGAASTTAWA